MKEIIVTAASVEEAVNKGCAQLGVEREDCQFEIISLPKKGFLGIGACGAKVRPPEENRLDHRWCCRDRDRRDRRRRDLPCADAAVQCGGEAHG